MNTAQRGIFSLAAAFLIFFANIAIHAQTQNQTAADSILQPVAPADIPGSGTFYRLSDYLDNGGTLGAPYPFLPTTNATVYSLNNGVFLVDNTSQTNDAEALNALALLLQPQDSFSANVLSGATGTSGAMEAMDSSFSPMFGGYSPMFDPTSLWLEITNVLDGVAYLNLHNATNQVYAIWSTTNLPGGWNVESELWPTNSDVMPFTEFTFDRQNLFLLAEDWTGVTENGNTVPDWWFWKYFGTTDLYDTNLDSTGGTLLSDYTNDFDPNIIQFSLQFTNTWFNTTTACGSLAISDGIPFYEAVLVNDTNLADAVWKPYTSTNVSVTFGTNGTYNVFVGLRGLPTNALQTWMGAQLTYDTVPPTLAITNPDPAIGTVSVPMIQLQGYVNESLSHLTFDVSNAMGIFTNQTGCLTGQFYDTNLLAYTTNYFQCYDVRLTNGINTITLRAVDLAGNETTANFNYTVDYSIVTKPPALTLIWPQNNALVCGSNFTIQAQVDDATATVTASITGTGVVQGLVERNGTVWVDNLPLSSGTNIVTLTATNAAGLGCATNFNVVQSALTVTMDPLPNNELNQALVTVTGTVSDSGYNVWVNGVQATVSGDPTWVATNVPVNPTGTASFTVVAGLDQNNPLTGQTIVLEQPSVVQIAAYDENFEDQENFNGDGGHSFEAIMRAVAWSINVGGYSRQNSVHFFNDDAGSTCDSYVAWPTNWPDGETVDGESCAGDYSESPNPAWQYASIPVQTYTLTYRGEHVLETSADQLSRTAHTKIELVAGGGQSSSGSQLILLTASAAAYSSLAVNSDSPGPAYFPENAFDGAGDTPLPASAIQILGQTLTPSATNAYVGQTFVTLSPGAVQDVTPTVIAALNQIDYSFNVQPTDVQFHIFDTNSGQDLSTQTNTVVVGQQMNLSCQLSLTNQDIVTSFPLSNFQWTVPGYAISNYAVASDSSSAMVVTGFPLNNSNVVFYWVDGASNRTVTCTATINGKTASAQAIFNVIRPTADWTAQADAVVSVDTNFVNSQEALHFGWRPSSNKGMVFNFANPNLAGYNGIGIFWWAQMGSRYIRVNLLTNDSGFIQTGNGLDVAFPAGGFLVSDAPANTVDDPGKFTFDLSKLLIQDTFTNYLFFQPQLSYGHSIKIPIKKIVWAWGGEALIDFTNLQWVLMTSPMNFQIPINNSNTMDFPTWSNNITNLTTIFTNSF